MDFSTLPSLIPKLWNFLFPPILDFFSIFAIGWFVFPRKTKLLESVYDWFLKFPEIRDYVDEFGTFFKRLKTPSFFNSTANLFLVIFMLYAVQLVVSGVGSSLPGFVDLEKGKFIAAFLGPSTTEAVKEKDDYELIKECLSIYSYSGDKNFSADEIYDDLTDSLTAYEKQNPAGIDPGDCVGYWLNERQSIVGILDAVKFFILWTLFCGFLSMVLILKKANFWHGFWIILMRFMFVLTSLTLFFNYFWISECHAIYRQGLDVREESGVYLDNQLRKTKVKGLENFQGQAVDLLKGNSPEDASKEPNVILRPSAASYVYLGWNKYKIVRGRSVHIHSWWGRIGD